MQEGYKTIVVNFANNICTIQLNQPERRNPLSQITAVELNDALLRAERNKDVRVVLLTGAGDAFSAGADLREFSRYMGNTPLQLYDSGRESTEMFKTGYRYTKPLIGAINGPAFAGGFGLVAMCHMVISADTAKFAMTEIKVGLFPFVIMPIIKRALGEKRALELSITGRVLTAEEAKSIGLVDEVVPREDLMKRARAFAEEIATRGPVGTRLGLTAYYESNFMEPTIAMDYLNSIRVVNFKSDDLAEGARAFLEKRMPEWKGE